VSLLSKKLGRIDVVCLAVCAFMLALLYNIYVTCSIKSRVPTIQ
jgi:hypothetical protein